MLLYDTHCHLQDDDFDTDRGEVLSRMREAGVRRINLIGCSRESNRRACALLDEIPEAFALIGIHPHDADEWDASEKAFIEEKLRDPRVLGIGEIGLDYHYDFHPRELQIRVMEEQIEWALGLGSPIVFHVREAFGDFLPRIRGRSLKGVMHCFSGSWESARECLDAGLYISFTGSVTFRNAEKLREVAKKIPRDRIMTETDAPYMTPVPLRGRRNEPAFVAHTAELLASIRGEDPEELAAVMTENGLRCFGGPPLI